MLIRREKSIVIEVYYAEDDEIIAKLCLSIKKSCKRASKR